MVEADTRPTSTCGRMSRLADHERWEPRVLATTGTASLPVRDDVLRDLALREPETLGHGYARDDWRVSGPVPIAVERVSLGGRDRSTFVATGQRGRFGKELDMFVQVIQGQVSDAARVRALMDRWVADLSSGATGWLGSTAGVTDDGEFVALARFESEEAAQQNSDRPEQSAWWDEMAAQFTGEPVFHNSTSVDVDTPGDPSQATFVQVMQGRTSDPERARELMADTPTDFAEFRPEVLGTVSVNHEGGDWTMAIYFTSEQAAREGERKEPPPEIQAMMEQLNALSVGEPTFLDLRDPWLDAPD